MTLSGRIERNIPGMLGTEIEFAPLTSHGNSNDGGSPAREAEELNQLCRTVNPTDKLKRARATTGGAKRKVLHMKRLRSTSYNRSARNAP